MKFLLFLFSDGNKKSNKPDTFVINFDSMHDPSASSEVIFFKNYLLQMILN